MTSKRKIGLATWEGGAAVCEARVVEMKFELNHLRGRYRVLRGGVHIASLLTQNEATARESFHWFIDDRFYPQCEDHQQRFEERQRLRADFAEARVRALKTTPSSLKVAAKTLDPEDFDIIAKLDSPEAVALAKRLKKGRTLSEKERKLAKAQRAGAVRSSKLQWHRIILDELEEIERAYTSNHALTFDWFILEWIQERHPKAVAPKPEAVRKWLHRRGIRAPKV